MNKKEISEIKKQLTPANCSITRICGCYVDGEKNKRMELKEAFLSLPEEESFKYFEILRKALSGRLGKNLLNMEFPLNQESIGGTQDFLLKLRDSNLADDELLEEFYDKVIKNYDYAENYYIILIHAAYDIPGKSSDNQEMFDASDEVYEHILCAICPVKLSKSGLSYEAEENRITNRQRDWVVDMPMHGFLFPAFNDRSSDIHGMLYYSKKPQELQGRFLDEVFGCKRVLAADEQKDIFNNIVSTVLGDDGKFEQLVSVYEQLDELVEENKYNPEPVILDRNAVLQLLAGSEITAEQLGVFDVAWDSCADENAELLVENIYPGKAITVELPGVNVKSDTSDIVRLEHKIIDGRYCLVIPTDRDISIDGVVVRN